MPLSEGSQQHSNSLRFLITQEGKLMFIHNRLLLEHPLETAAVIDTTAAIRPPVRLSIREAVLNICSEEGKRCRAYRSGSLSIPQGKAFGPEDSRYYWKYSHSPSAGLQLRTTADNISCWVRIKALAIWNIPQNNSIMCSSCSMRHKKTNARVLKTWKWDLMTWVRTQCRIMTLGHTAN